MVAHRTDPPALGSVPRTLVVSVWLAVALGPLNSSMIAVALVSLQRDFGVSLAAVTPLISSFYVGSVVAYAMMGRLADLVGPRRVFCVGLAIVGLVGLVAPLAPSLGWLTAARVALALGTAAAFPAGLALIRRAADPSGPPPSGALGGVMISAAVTTALGPALGGILVQMLGWQAIFLVNVPCVAVGLALALRGIAADDVAGVPAALLRRIDWAGITCFAVALTALLLFIVRLGDSTLWEALIVALCAGALLVVRERRASTPFIDMAVIGDGPLAAVFAQYAAVNVVFYATFFAVPQWLEQVRGYGPGEVGLVMLSLAGMGVLVTPVASRVTSRRGPRPILLLGGCTLLAGTSLLLVLDSQSSLAVLLAVLVVLGIPNGCNNIGLQALLYERSTDRHQGAAAGFFMTSRYTAAVLSTAVMGAVLGHQATTEGLHTLALLAAPVALAVLLAGVRTRPAKLAHHPTDAPAPG
jgi:MFS family permease